MLNRVNPSPIFAKKGIKHETNTFWRLEHEEDQCWGLNPAGEM